MLRKFAFMFLAVVCGTGLFAEENYNISHFSRDSVCFINQPKQWDGADWMKIGFIGAGAVVIMQFDGKIQNAIPQDHKYDNSAVIVGGRLWGDVYPTLIIAGTFGLHGWAFGDNSSKRLTVEIVQATLYSAVLTEVLKTVIGRSRPYKNQGAFTFRPFSLFKTDYNSFPSGHSTAAFAVSTVIANNVDSDYLKALAYAPAVCTMVSRSYQNKHWASDTFVGAAIGYSVGAWIVDEDKKSKSRIKVSSIYPPTIQISF